MKRPRPIRTGSLAESYLSTRALGFSQKHRIDLAWPGPEVGPGICAESKVNGAQAFDGTPARGALAD